MFTLPCPLLPVTAPVAVGVNDTPDEDEGDAFMLAFMFMPVFMAFEFGFVFVFGL